MCVCLCDCIHVVHVAFKCILYLIYLSFMFILFVQIFFDCRKLGNTVILHNKTCNSKAFLIRKHSSTNQ